MDNTYAILREFAGTWALVGLFAFFIGASVWAFWPSQRAAREDAAGIPFRNETASDGGRDRTGRAANDEEPTNG